MGPTLGVNVKLERTNTKLIPPIKALYLERTCTCVNCTIIIEYCCRHVMQRGAKSYNYPALITWPARPAEPRAEPFWHVARSHFGTLHSLLYMSFTGGQRSRYNLYAWRERAWKSRLYMYYVLRKLQRCNSRAYGAGAGAS